MATLNISLPDPMKEFVEEETARGGFSSASEYVRALIREAQKRSARQDLEDKLLAGMASNESAWTRERSNKLRDDVRKSLKARARKR